MALTEFTNALFKNALADGPEHEAEHTSLEVLAVGYDYCVDIGRAVRLTREGVGVAGNESMLMMAPFPRLGESRGGGVREAQQRHRVKVDDPGNVIRTLLQKPGSGIQFMPALLTRMP